MPRQPGQRAGTQAWLANTWPSSHPGLDSGVPDPGGGREPWHGVRLSDPQGFVVQGYKHPGS